jgi:polysaccharide biosynthesis/export protein
MVVKSNWRIKIIRDLVRGLTASALVGIAVSETSLAQLPPPPPPLPEPVPLPIPAPAPAPIPASPAPAPGTSPVTVRSEVYTLGAGDRIQMDIFNVPEYSGPNGQHQVQADGSLILPLIGSVSVYGMTLEQAADKIKGRYNKYLKRPWVTLKLLAPRPLQIAIAGEINRPGAYTISAAAGPGGTTDQIGTQMPTISRALRMAGGITQSADVRQIKIRRPQRNATEQIINVDLWELLQNGDLRSDITLRDGDTIFIPTVTSLNRQESPTLAVANIAGKSTQPINIAVVGEVNRPGTYTLASDVQNRVQNDRPSDNSGLFASSNNEAGEGETVFQQTVTRAIKMAGGITPLADISGDVSQDLALQQGDTVMIPKVENIDAAQNAEVANATFSPDTIKVSVVGEVVKPGAIALPPNTSLNQALVAAGGFNKARADMTSVDLIRLNPNGSVSKLAVKINFSATANDENNPKLQNNDVIMVRRSGRAAFSDNVGGAIAPLSPLWGILRVFDIFR